MASDHPGKRRRAGLYFDVIDIARAVYRLTGHDPAAVTDVTTAEYFADQAGPIAPRPLNSVLDLSRIQATGWTPRGADATLEAYLGTRP